MATVSVTRRRGGQPIPDEGVPFDAGTGMQTMQPDQPGGVRPSPVAGPYHTNTGPLTPAAPPQSQPDQTPRVPSSPFPPNTPIGSTGFSTPGADEIRRRLEAVSRGLQVTEQDVADAQRVNQGESIESRLQEFANQYARRAAPTSSRQHDSQSGLYDNTPLDSSWIARFGAGGAGGFQMPGGPLFDDPATSQLENLLRQQLAALSAPNPQLQQLTDFLNQRFAELSRAPGYSPEELAVMRTQAFEPAEAYRQASKQRQLERTGARGMLPSSGLHELGMQDIDIAADKNRTALDRDLAINQIGERNRDLGMAAQVAQQAYQIPWMDQMQRMQDMLSRSSLMYELPQRAMTSAQSVLNGSPGPESLFNQFASQAQLLQQQQQMNAQRNAQMWSSIGQMLANLWQQ